jgi:hypothetical protein
VAMNVAHDFERADNDTITVGGRHWIISNKISTGNTESIVQALAVLATVWLGARLCGWGQDCVTVALLEALGPKGRIASGPRP